MARVALAAPDAVIRPVAQCLLQVGDRADDLLERAAFAPRVGELLAGQEPACFILVAPAHLPALEQSVVDRPAHPAAIGSAF